MTGQEIKVILENAISEVKRNDHQLLINDLSERSISYKLGVYLNYKFPGYHVDCEYNGYARSDNQKKYIIILRQKIIDLGRLRDSDRDKYLLKRSVYPDIIVHKREEDNNLLIIEVKKSTNNEIAFDHEKLSRYTSNEYENNLNYQFGALITFITGSMEMTHKVDWYRNGQLTTI